FVPVTAPRRQRRASIPEEEVAVAQLPGRWRFRSVQVFLEFFQFLFALFAEEFVHRVPLFGRITKKSKKKSPERFRSLLEGLSGAFVKFGQFLSMRSDILP